MKGLIVSCLMLFGIQAHAKGCLNDQTILSDGSWVYTGVGQGSQQAGDDRIVVSITTDTASNKRFLSFDRPIFLGAQDKYEITQCSTPVGAYEPFTYFVRSRELTKLDVLQIVEAKVEVIAGRPVVIPSTDGALYSYTLYYHYSTEGMKRENQESAFFLPGYHIGTPQYDDTGKLILHWDGTQPARVP